MSEKPRDIEFIVSEIKSRCDAATEGPWKWEEPDEYEQKQEDYHRETKIAQSSWLENVLEYEGCGTHGCEGKIEDKNFIAHARTDVPWLVEKVKKLQAENERLREALEKIESESCAVAGDEYHCGIARQALKHEGNE